MSDIRAIELFCCAGGMAEGFRRAGIEFSTAVDASQDACDSYEANLGHRPVQMDVHDLLARTQHGWRPPPLDLVVADPPCTPWSRAGKRQGLADERDCMPTTIALILAWRPRAYLIGNVPGLGDDHNLPLMQSLLAPLREAGYCTADWARLNAADYGVPQHRRRPFWFGHLGGDCIAWPKRTHTDPATLHTGSLFPSQALKPWVTAREALAILPPEEWGQPVWLARGMNRKGGSSARDNHPITEPDAPARTVTAHWTRECHFLAWPWERPATTVCARPEIGPPGHRYRGCDQKYSQSTHPNAVQLSERAAAVLQDFPPDWTFSGKTKTARWKQIGQAMPPGLAAAVARSIRAWFSEDTR